MDAFLDGGRNEKRLGRMKNPATLKKKMFYAERRLKKL